MKIGNILSKYNIPYEKEYSLSVLERINVKPMIRIEELTILELKKILEELKNEN